MKDQLRVLLITAKMLQLCADVFAVFGIFLFAFIYFNTYSDKAMQAMHDPFFVVTILVPFIPAAVMAYAAARKRKQIRALLEQNQKTP